LKTFDSEQRKRDVELFAKSYYQHDEYVSEIPRESRQFADDKNENTDREVVIH